MIATTSTNDVLLEQLSFGMRVFDIDRRPLGTIHSVYLPGLRPAHQEEWNTPPVIQTIAGTFIEDQCLPELLVVRLGRTGFVRVRDIHHSAEYYMVTPQQIHQVSTRSSVLTLKVPLSVVAHY